MARTIKQHNTHAEKETAKLAADLAAEITFPGLILLRGALGSGKSVFARALIRTLTGNPEEEVPSPTFTLVQTYDALRGPLWHFDLYRVKDADEIYALGWEEALAEGLAIVEWPERIEGLIPAGALDIRIANADNKNDSRVITIQRLV